MKKITFLFMLLAVSLGYSQIVLEDFEGGQIPDGVGGLFGDNVESLTQLANPDMGPGSGNESATVLELVTKNASVPWQNAQLYFQDGKTVDLTDENATGNKEMTVDIWHMGDPTFILAKVVDGSEFDEDNNNESATDAQHGGTGWETLTFDFSVNKDNSAVADDTYGRILFFPIWNGNGYDGSDGDSPVFTTYYDNISKVDATASTEDVSKLAFKALPNPTSSSWTLSSQNLDIISVSVFDVLGKNVISLAPNKRTVVIDGASLKSGLYFAQVKTANGLSSLKLIRK